MTPSDDSRRGGLSRTARLTLVAATLVVLVAAFFVARGGGEDDGPSRAGSAATPQGTQPAPETAQPAPAAQEPGHVDPDPRKPKAAAPTVRTIRVRGGAPVGDAKTLTYRRGDTIRLRVAADAPDEVHVHGFDVEKPVGPSAPARFTIKADIEGRFEVELHGSGTLIATLEVRPAS